MKQKILAILLALALLVLPACSDALVDETPAPAQSTTETVQQEEPAAEPKQEAPAAEPKQEAPATEPKQEEPAAEPKQEAPATEPKQEAPAAEPKQEAPATEPKQEAPAAEPKQEETSEPMVWIPTNGGKKYHNNASCSKMVDPEHVTKSKAISLGFDACKRCYN